MRGSGSSLFPVKHCWIRKTNMATICSVWRFRTGFFSTFSLFVRSQGWSQITDSTKQKIAIFKLFWKYLLSKNVSFEFWLERSDCGVVMRQGDTHTSIAFYLMSFINWTTIFILVQIIIYFHLVSVLLHSCCITLISLSTCSFTDVGNST